MKRKNRECVPINFDVVKILEQKCDAAGGSCQRVAATSSEPRGRPEPCLTWHLCVEEALDSHALKLRVLLLILPCGVISQESFWKVDSQRAEFSVQKVMGPGWVNRANSVKAVQQFW